jgi:Icc-related predicted phosphoesterase
MVSVLAFSDLHHSASHAAALCAAADRADLVIGAGDFCNARGGLAQAMALIRPMEGKSVLVAGNHESVAELRAATRALVLHGEAAEIQGLKLFGIGYAAGDAPLGSPFCELTEAEAEALLAGMEPCDILISHTPPKGVADTSSRGRSYGSTAVRAAIERHQPRWCLCGHVHAGQGIRAMIGRTQVINLGPKPTFLDI